MAESDARVGECNLAAGDWESDFYFGVLWHGQRAGGGEGGFFPEGSVEQCRLWNSLHDADFQGWICLWNSRARAAGLSAGVRGCEGWEGEVADGAGVGRGC